MIHLSVSKDNQAQYDLFICVFAVSLQKLLANRPSLSVYEPFVTGGGVERGLFGRVWEAECCCSLD